MENKDALDVIPELPSIYDEPFAGLDPISLGVVGQLIRRLNDALGVTSVSPEVGKVRTPRTKAMLFVSPSNPTGAVYSPAETEAIGRWAVEKGVWVLTDEIYEHLVYGDDRFGPWIAPSRSYMEQPALLAVTYLLLAAAMLLAHRFAISPGQTPVAAEAGGEEPARTGPVAAE